jgi:hypothetical protein
VRKWSDVDGIIWSGIGAGTLSGGDGWMTPSVAAEKSKLMPIFLDYFIHNL